MRNNMYKLCKTEQSVKRQREIEQILFDIMKVKRYEDITITEICETLKMPRKAFYRYFDSKDDAVHALIEHKMIEYEGFSQKNTGANITIKKEIENFFLFWYKNRDMIEVLDKNELLSMLFMKALSFPIKDFISISKYLPNDSDWAKDRIFEFAVCGLMFEAMSWYREGFKTNVSDIVDVSFRILSQPLFPNLSKYGTLNR